jgi:hypothetical protein
MLINCLYFIISRKDDIRLIPASLALFGLIWIFGNGTVSDTDQKNRLISALQKAGRMENGLIHPDSTAVDSVTLGKLKSAAAYFSERGNLRILDACLPLPADSITVGDDRYSGSDVFINWLGIPDSNGFTDNLVSLSMRVAPLNADISGYNRMTILSFDDFDEPCSDTTSGHNCFALNKAENHIVWSKLQESGHITVDSFNMAPLLKQWDHLCSQKDQSDFALEGRTDLTSAKRQVGVIAANVTVLKKRFNVTRKRSTLHSVQQPLTIQKKHLTSGEKSGDDSLATERRYG